ASSDRLANTGAHGGLAALGGLLLAGGVSASLIARRRRV
ncbi:MAG: LPXTG cell wall anchor domain-containing protein, partial [Umezawaea sp.]